MAAPVVLAFVSETKLDLSRYNAVIFPAAIAELCADEDARRQLGIALISGLAQRSSEPEVLAGMVLELGEHLLGKKTVLSQWRTRVSFVEALVAMAQGTAAGSDALAANAKTAILHLCPFLDAEPHPLAKRAGVEALAKWVLINKKIPPVATNLLIKHISASALKLKDGPELLPAFLAAARALVRFPAVKAAVEQARKDLISHVKLAATSPAKNRLAGLLSVELLVSLSQESHDPKAWLKLVTDPLSFVNSAAMIRKGTQEEGLSQLRLFAALMQHLYVVPADADLGPLMQSTMTTALTTMHVVSREALVVLGEAIRLQPQLTHDLVQGLYATLHDHFPVPAEGFVQPDTFSKLLACLAPTMPVQGLPVIALMAHDPLMHASAANPFSTWGRLQSMWTRGAKKGAMELAVMKNIKGIKQVVLFEEGLLSECPRRRASAVGLLTSIALVRKQTFKQFLPELLLRLAPAAILEATEEQEAVFNTPEGTVCEWTATKEGFQPQAVENKNVKRSKHSLYSAEDEEWERQVAAEVAAKKTGKKGSVKVDPAVRAKLAEQKAVRDTLRASLRQVESSAQALTALVARCPVAAREALQALLEPLYALMGNGITAELARSLHASLGRSLDTKVRAIASPLGHAVHQAVSMGVGVFQNEFAVEGLLAVLDKCADISEDGSIDCSFLSYLLPVIQVTLDPAGGAREDESAQSALDILEAFAKPAHVAASVPLPTKDVLDLLLSVMYNGGELREQAKEALLALSPGLANLHVAPLLGDAGALSSSQELRTAVLQSMGLMKLAKPFPPTLVTTLWLLANDTVEAVSTTADELWDTLEMELDEAYAEPILPLMCHKRENVRAAAGEALAAACMDFPDTTSATLQSLVLIFHNNQDKEAQNNGFRQQQTIVYKHPTRQAVGLALCAMADTLGSRALMEQAFAFVLQHGLADANSAVWEGVLEAGLKLIDLHGAAHLELLLPLFERNMVQLDNPMLSANEGDRVAEGLVVFMGTVARHLSADDTKILDIVDHLIEALKTPSHSVQKSVAKCLAPLMTLAVVVEHTPRLVQNCIEQLAKGGNYGERKGAAFGVAAMVKGLKLSSLKKYNVLTTLSEYVQDKNSSKARQGALFAYDRLFCELGNKFEPYVDHILPYLLTSFSDSNPDVREAAAEASQQIMANLTGYGVQRALPRVLAALDEKGWKTKAEAITLLGSMAYCAPRQLSSCLPMIVPRLLEVSADPHKKLQEATKDALKRIGSVIRNPEIRRLVPVLLKVLRPRAHTRMHL